MEPSNLSLAPICMRTEEITSLELSLFRAIELTLVTLDQTKQYIYLSLTSGLKFCVLNTIQGINQFLVHVSCGENPLSPKSK